jgi:hypothetical protein
MYKNQNAIKKLYLKFKKFAEFYKFCTKFPQIFEHVVFTSEPIDWIAQLNHFDSVPFVWVRFGSTHKCSTILKSGRYGGE